MKITIEASDNAAALAAELGRPAQTTDPADPAKLVPNPVTPADFILGFVAAAFLARLKERRRVALNATAPDMSNAPVVHS